MQENPNLNALHGLWSPQIKRKEGIIACPLFPVCFVLPAPAPIAVENSRSTQTRRVSACTGGGGR